MNKLTVAMENYLEAVYELSSEGAGSRVSDIAARIDVSKASVNNAMNVLAAKGLVENEKYREIYLTPKGLELARLISSKHGIIQRMFTEVLGIREEIAFNDACAIEHVISTESVQKISEFLRKYGNSSFCTNDME